MPSVQRVHNEFKEKGVVVLAISVDDSGAPVETYLAEGNYTMPVVLDASREMANKFGFLGTPATYIINRQGDLVASGRGPLDFDRAEFRQYLQFLIDQPAPG